MNFIASLILSSLSHIALVIALLLIAPPSVPPKPAPNKNNSALQDVKIINKSVEATIASKDDLKIKKDDGKPRHLKDKCERYFGGVGVSIYFNGTITHVHPGYPAARAGVMEGDVLYGEDVLRGEPGTPVIFRVMRDGKLLLFSVIRDKICYESIKESP